MASQHTVPLMFDQDFELGSADLPNYDQATKPQPAREARIDARGGAKTHFWSEKGENSQQDGFVEGIFSKHLRHVDEQSSVAFAQLHIRLGIIC